MLIIDYRPGVEQVLLKKGFSKEQVQKAIDEIHQFMNRKKSLYVSHDEQCPICGSFEMIQSGTCKTCRSCGYAGSCG